LKRLEWSRAYCVVDAPSLSPVMPIRCASTVPVATAASIPASSAAN
jgi:hypothetical protein